MNEPTPYDPAIPVVTELSRTGKPTKVYLARNLAAGQALFRARVNGGTACGAMTCRAAAYRGDWRHPSSDRLDEGRAVALLDAADTDVLSLGERAEAP